MAGHDAGQSGGPTTPMQPWPGGWLWALIAGIIAAVLARWLGDITAVTAVLIGIFVFLVFGVLLGMFWDAPSPNALGANAGGHHDDHGHDDHGHDGHGHDDHGHHPVATPAPFVTPAAVPALAPAAAAPAPVAAVIPVAEPFVSSEPAKPMGLSGPRGGKGDDLKALEGIGPGLEKLCHELGIFHFDQIAGWGAGEVAWMDGNLKGFKGRVSRDKWVSQARIIGAEGLDAFRIRAKTNDY